MLHGGDLSEAIRQFGGDRAQWIDLSTGINPHAYAFREIALSDVLRPLPEAAAADALLEAARRAYGVPGGAGLIAAPGTESILATLPRVATRGATCIVSPTYSSHERYWSAGGGTVYLIDSLDEVPQDVRHVVIVNPNNPDGRLTPPEKLVAFATELAARGGLLVVDEAFCDVTPEASILPLLGDLPVAVLRSFGKFFGLAGLRLGFLAGPKDLCTAIETALGGWAVSGPALAIGAQALNDVTWQASMRARLEAEAAALDSALAAQGIEVLGGTSLFRLLHIPDARTIHTALAERHIWTRCFEDAPDRLRIGLPASSSDWQRVIEAFADVLHANGTPGTMVR